MALHFLIACVKVKSFVGSKGKPDFSNCFCSQPVPFCIFGYKLTYIVRALLSDPGAPAYHCFFLVSRNPLPGCLNPRSPSDPGFNPLTDHTISDDILRPYHGLWVKIGLVKLRFLWVRNMEFHHFRSQRKKKKHEITNLKQMILELLQCWKTSWLVG